MKIEISRMTKRSRPTLKNLRCLCEMVCAEEGGEADAILSVILVDDPYIRDLNKRFLNRDRATDVISFPMKDDTSPLLGEIYVSEDHAKMQAKVYQVHFKNELARLMIHGVLHLFSYNDQSPEEKTRMTARENYYLEKLKKTPCY